MPSIFPAGGVWQGMQELVLQTDRLTAYNRTDPTFLVFGRQAVAAVRGVSLTLHAGECLAVLGESGAGKSTLLRTVAGHQPAAAGRVLLLGREVTGRSDPAIQYIPQDPRSVFNPDVPFGDQVEGADGARLERAMADLGLGREFRERRPGTCSGGQVQRLALARALARAPRVLALDEPASGVDPHTAGLILQALRRALVADGVAVLLATHDLRLARRLARRAAVLLHGHLVEVGPLAAVLDGPRHPHTRQYLGLVPERRPADADLAGAGDGGCPFAGRCPEELPHCRTQLPDLAEAAPGHRVACHRTD